MDWHARIVDEGVANYEHGGTAEKGMSTGMLRVGMGLTLNKGNYKSTKINVDIGTPTTWEEKDKAYEASKLFLERMIGVLIAKLKGEAISSERIPTFDYGTKDSRLGVRISRGETVPLDNYESAKIYVSYSTDVIKEDLNIAEVDIIDWIDKKITNELSELNS